MKTIKLIFVAALYFFSSMNYVQSQTKLYVSKSTKEFSTKSGSKTENSDKYKHFTAEVSTIGPITQTITPEDLSLETNNPGKTWTGTVKPDLDDIPEPGEIEIGKLIIAYDGYYSRVKKPLLPPGVYGTNTIEVFEVKLDPDQDDNPDNNPYMCSGCNAHGGVPGKHEIIHMKGKITQKFRVYSLNVKITKAKCKTNDDGSLTVECEAKGYKEPGTYEWEILGKTFTGKSITKTINCDKWDFTKDQDIVVKVTFKKNGVTYSSLTNIKAKKKVFHNTHPPNKVVFLNNTNIQKIKIFHTKGCTVKWSVNNGHIKENPPHLQKPTKSIFYFKTVSKGTSIVTAEIKFCGKVVGKETIKRKVK